MSSQTIYVSLLNEGTAVWKPVEAERSADGTFRIVSEMLADEEWAFKSGEKVTVRQHAFSDGETGLVADRRAAS